MKYKFIEEGNWLNMKTFHIYSLIDNILCLAISFERNERKNSLMKEFTYEMKEFTYLKRYLALWFLIIISN